MKLQHKYTGEIIDLGEGYIGDAYSGNQIIIKPVAALDEEYRYNSLAELNEEWEDYKEPRGYWFISTMGLVKYDNTPFCGVHESRKSIGNYFETREEAEKAVEVLKTWKRLRDKGFSFCWPKGKDRSAEGEI